ncbi:50S ribosomal protein L4 [Mesomycoplasma lagogenitalium]|uniref:Large ribosomal subunit protein uL4 n=1 Tax=Mesomycoplasma lagogenitalium TaxID=171286 RepID=A0ABY8LTM0_9BACT|nr:50S ribosomal protein L4 [Mesomycoplasma lagogenitalium]WGI36587.1 50S ribosomal protein L4 [Mesomycoplasma lagogenitalium]
MAETKKTTVKKTASSSKTTKTSAPRKTPVKTSKSATTVKVEKTFDLPKSVFGLDKFYSQAVFDTIIAERASRRQGTHKVKNRAEVSGTGKKPWRQKGTGRARAGSMRSPIWVGGGRAFGPTVERNYNLKVNKKVRSLALFSALSELAKNNQVIVSDVKVEKYSTKELLSQLSALKLNQLRHILLVSNDEKTFISGRNLQNLVIRKVSSLLVEDLIQADVLVISQEDIKYLEGLVK